MIPLPDLDIAEMAAHIASGDCPYATIEKLETLSIEDRTAVYKAAHPIAEASLKKAIVAGDLDLVRPTLRTMAEVTQKLGDYTLARAMLMDLIPWEKRYTPYGTGYLVTIAFMLKEQGDLTTARHCMEDAVAIVRRDKHDGMTAHMLFGLALIAKEQGKVEDVRKCFAESFELEQIWHKNSSDLGPEYLAGRVFMFCYECATLFLANKQPLAAVPLLAAAQVIGQKKEGLHAEYHEHADFQAALAQAREQTDETHFAQAWERGLTMTTEEIQRHISV